MIGSRPPNPEAEKLRRRIVELVKRQPHVSAADAARAVGKSVAYVRPLLNLAKASVGNRETENVAKIRQAIKSTKTKPTIATVCRDTGMAYTLVERLVRTHHLDVAYRAKETTEAVGQEYCAAIEEFRLFCESGQRNFRRSMIEALRQFTRKHG